jgi:hypothetical protein
MQTLNAKTKAHYINLANEVVAAQRRLQEFIAGAALAMDVDVETHNFDQATMCFVPKPVAVATPVEVMPEPSPQSSENGLAHGA